MKRAVMSALLSGRLALFLMSVTLFSLQTSTPKVAEDEENGPSFTGACQIMSFKEYLKKTFLDPDGYPEHHQNFNICSYNFELFC